MKRKVWGFLAMAALVGLDQWTKWLAEAHLQSGPLVLIPGVFELRYLQNTGGAFSLFAGQVQVFAVLTALLSVVLVAAYCKLPPTGEYAVYRLLLVFLAAGGIGNVIDRVARGYVVDFFYFSLIDFPVFNVADIFVTVSIIVFAVYYLVSKDDRLERLFKKKKANDPPKA